MKDGQYYILECGNAFWNGRPLPIADYTQAEVVQLAEDHEATARLITIEDDQIIDCIEIGE